MNKNILWTVLGAILIVLIAVGIIFALNRPTSETAQADQAPATVADDQTGMEQQSFKELALSGRSQQCEFTDAQSGTAGTIYTGDGKMRGDFQATSGGLTIDGHMVSDGTDIYVWVDGMTSGLKMPLTAAATSSPATASEQVDLDHKVSVRCQSWSVDGSKFDLPSGVQFSDMSAAAAGSGSASTSSQADQCASCETVPAEYRDQCRQALGC